MSAAGSLPVAAGVPQHMGPMHGFEAALFYLLVFGPLLALAITLVVVRRRDSRLEETEPEHHG